MTSSFRLLSVSVSDRDQDVEMTGNFGLIQEIFISKTFNQMNLLLWALKMQNRQQKLVKWLKWLKICQFHHRNISVASVPMTTTRQ